MQLARYSLMFLFFLAKKVSDKMKNMPEGFISLAQPLGWMTQENFLIALKHLHSQVKCTKQKPILLIMENHISHMGCSICGFAKENGIILQTLPPHTSHAFQPLNRTIYGPFKCHLAKIHSTG
jgi:Zn ribbon nucleic-acid-binding protein